MLDISNSLSTSNVEDCGRRRSTFYVPLSESLENYLPPGVSPISSPRYVSTPAPQRFLLRSRKGVSRTKSDGSPSSNIFNTFPTKIPPKNLGLSKCSSDIDFSESPKLSLPPEMNLETKIDAPSKAEVTKSQTDLSTAMLVKVKAKEIEVCKSPLRGTLSGTDVKQLLKKERSFIGLSTSKSASKISLTESVKRSNSKINISVDSPSEKRNPVVRSASKGSSVSSLFLSPSKSDLSQSDKPKTAFSLIRRSHSTKLSRSNSLLKPFLKSEPEDIDGPIVDLKDGDYFSEILKQYDDSGGKLNLVDAVVYGTLVHGSGAGLSPLQTRKSAIRSCLDAEEEAIHSDTSYEKACRRGSGGTQGTVQVTNSPSRLAAFFFSKRSLRASPLKRARSAAKLAPRTPLRSSRSHESLLSQPAACVATVVGGTVRPLHASLAGGKPHCFTLSLPGPPPSTRYFACGSRLERDTWINNLRVSLQPDSCNGRRTERTLRLYLLEAKGLPPKKRYYCEIMLDATLYARTSSKLKTDLCFWGEVFEFPGLPHINTITIDVYREPDRKPRKRDKRFLVGSVKIPIHELLGRHQSERWHPIVNLSNDLNGDTIVPPTLRVKCRFQTLEVLSPPLYEPLLYYLRENYTKLLEYLEPIIGVKGKEEVAAALVGTIRAAGGAAAAARLLAVAAALEVRRAPHAALAFRANSLATKATEAYMKMLGETYLQETLWECVSSAMSGGASGVWEVDPAKGAGAGSGLRRQRSRLRAAVARTWRAVRESANKFPLDLRLTFAAFREQLRSMQREELADHIVSASVFLRFVCPAILSPSLFGITQEYPDEKAARNLTLVAKTLQTLANFTRFQGKEAFMEFLNEFLEEEAPNMRLFLKEISTLPPGCEMNLSEEWGSGPGAGHLDLGKQLAALHLLLAECVPKLPMPSLQELNPLPSILETLNDQLQEHSLPQTDTSPIVHENIFKFNDPTYSPCSGDLTIAHSSPLLNHNVLQVNTISSSGSSQHDDTIAPPKYNTALLNQLNLRKSPNLGIRAATLPRNNFQNVNTQNPDRYSSQYNNREHCINLKVVQIGIDQKNASSPSLMRKVNGSNGSINLHSIQRAEPLGRIDDAYTKKIYAENPIKNDAINYGNAYKVKEMQNNIPTNLEEFSDLLRYADDQEIEPSDDNIINQRINHDIVPQTINNANHLVNHNHIHNGGSNVSISALSNVASSGYQSFATYSQSSSPVELYQPANYAENSPAHHPRRPGMIDRKNHLNKNPGQLQRLEYERQKFGIQNFTTDTGKSSPRLITSGPLTFKNPVYHVDDNHDDPAPAIVRDESNSNIPRQIPKCSISTSSSSIDDTDNADSDNKAYRNLKLKRNSAKQSKPDPRRVAAKPEVRKPIEYDPRRSRQPRTNPNVTHFGQSDYPNNNEPKEVKHRPDSNVEETNKEMYRLQLSRSQKAVGENYSSSNIPRMMEKYDAKNNNEVDVRITKNGYPPSYMKNVSSTRLNEELNFNIEDVVENEREGLDRAIRRLSLEGIGDSSSDQENSCYHTTGRRRVTKAQRSIHQYGREIEKMKGHIDILKQKIKSGEKIEELNCGSDSKMKGIITKLLDVEEELRKEQQAMAAVLSKKQRVIEKQNQRLAALGAANKRLLTALHQLHPDIPSEALDNLNVPDGDIYDPQPEYLFTDKMNPPQNLHVKEYEAIDDLDKRVNARQPMYHIQKSPSYQHIDTRSNFYQDKSASNQHLDMRHKYKSDKLDTHHQMYHDKGKLNLQNDDEVFAYDGKLNRNSDPISQRHYGQEYQRQDASAQFNPSDAALPSDGHQAVVATQPAVYYGNNA